MEYINVFSAGSKAYQHLTSPTQAQVGAPQVSSGLAGGLIAVIVIFALVGLGLFIWAAYALYRFWRLLPTIAALASLALLVFGFAPFSLLVTYAAKRA